MRSNRIDSVRGPVDRNFRTVRPRFSIQFSISSPVIVRNRRIEPKFGLLNLSISYREVLQTEFRKLRRKRAAAGCESRKIMAHLSENPSECSVRPASNRTKFSVRFCGLRQCHVHFSIVIGPSTVTQCDASRQTQAKLATAGLLSEIQWCRLV